LVFQKKKSLEPCRKFITERERVFRAWGKKLLRAIGRKGVGVCPRSNLEARAETS